MPRTSPAAAWKLCAAMGCEDRYSARFRRAAISSPKLQNAASPARVWKLQVRRHRAHAIAPRRSVGRRSCDPGSHHPIVAAALEFVRERLVARFHDASAREDMDLIRDDVIQQPLVELRDQYHGPVGIAQAVDARGNDLEGIDVPARNRSRPESASFGSSTSICSTSLRFFSPPEKRPSLTPRVKNDSLICMNFIFCI